MTEPTKPLSFRLRTSLHDVLAERAAGAGESPAEFARSIVVAALENPATDQLLNDNQTLRADVLRVGREVAMLRRQFEAVTKMVVANFFEAADAELKEWLKAIFADPEGGGRA